MESSIEAKMSSRLALETAEQRAKQAEEQEIQQARYATLLTNVSIAITERLSLHDSMQECLQAVVHYLHASFAGIWTFNKDKGVLELEASVGRYSDPYGPYDQIATEILGSSLNTHERRSHLINDIFNDPRINNKEWATQEGIVTFAGYPLIVENQFVGAMAVFASATLTDEIFNVLTSMANTIALGIKRKWAEERLEERTRELSLVLEVAHNVAQTTELRPLLSIVLDQLKIIVDYTSAAFFSVEGKNLFILDYRGRLMPEEVFPLRFPIEQVVIYQELFHHRTPFIIDDLQGDSSLAQTFRESSNEELNRVFGYPRSLIGVPLVIKERVIGILQINSSEPNSYRAQHSEIAFALATQIAVALENARLNHDIQALAALKERQHLALELHDSVSQVLYGIGLGAHAVREALDNNSKEAIEPIEYVISLAESGLIEMQALIFELQPESLKVEGLISALNKQVMVLRMRYKLAVDPHLDDEPDISLETKRALHLITQEAFHNIIKHADANAVTLRLTEQDNEIGLEVHDNGRGFNSKASFPEHFGLHSMQERATHLGGTFLIESTAGQGTSIWVRVPKLPTL